LKSLLKISIGVILFIYNTLPFAFHLHSLYKNIFDETSSLYEDSDALMNISHLIL
jgi:hypothetical protein